LENDGKYIVNREGKWGAEIMRMGIKDHPLAKIGPFQLTP